MGGSRGQQWALNFIPVETELKDIKSKCWVAFGDEEKGILSAFSAFYHLYY